MSFRNGMHEIISTTIASHLQLCETDVHFGPFLGETSDNTWFLKFLKALFENEVFSPEDFRGAVIKGVKTFGYVMQGQVLHGEYPDHIISPPALAYVLRRGDIDPASARRIRFDHGETLEQFQSRADGLIDKILHQLSSL